MNHQPPEPGFWHAYRNNVEELFYFNGHDYVDGSGEVVDKTTIIYFNGRAFFNHRGEEVEEIPDPPELRMIQFLNSCTDPRRTVISNLRLLSQQIVDFF